MPPYIPGYCDPQMSPPYHFKGVSIWVFPLVARYGALKGVVDRYLNVAPSGSVDFKFKPLGNPLLNSSLVYMMVLHYDRMLCPQGFMIQNEFYFAIPFVRLKEGLPVDFGLFTPYIFVDNPWSMICGNMVAGFPKQMAWFRMPREGVDPYPIEIDALVFTKFSPDTPLTWQRVLNVHSSLLGFLQEEAAEAASWPFGDVDSLFGPQGRVPIESALLEPLREFAANGVYSIAQLQQIRDAVQSDTACYQAVISFKVGLDSAPAFRPLPAAAIDLPAYPSLRIGKELGLLYDLNGKLLPILPYRVDCDFSIIDPEVLYSATGTVPMPASPPPPSPRSQRPGGSPASRPAGRRRGRRDTRQA